MRVSHDPSDPASVSLDGAPPWRGPLVTNLVLASRAVPFSAPGWLFELKYDGYRLLAAKAGDGVELRYRSGRVVTSVFPELAEAVRGLPCDRALLDGELVALDADGRTDFELLRARAVRHRPAGAEQVAVFAFDLLALDGHDLRGLRLLVRKALLRSLVGGGGRLRYVDHVLEHGEGLFARARELGLEGVVAKRSDSAYEPGRSGAWRKLKVEDTLDLVVIGVATPAADTSWHPGLVVARPERGGLRCVGRVAVGDRELRALERLLPQLQRAAPPCADAGTAEIWLEPAVACEVRSLPCHGGDGLRHPVFLRFRPDKHVGPPRGGR